jgi:hypothetical protein
LPPSHTKNLTISNISSLDLNAQLSASKHFYLIDAETGNLAREMLCNIKTGTSLHLGIVFDTSFKHDSHNEVINGQLNLNYLEHEQNVAAFFSNYS